MTTPYFPQKKVWRKSTLRLTPVVLFLFKSDGIFHSIFAPLASATYDSTVESQPGWVRGDRQQHAVGMASSNSTLDLIRSPGCVVWLLCITRGWGNFDPRTQSFVALPGSGRDNQGRASVPTNHVLSRLIVLWPVVEQGGTSDKAGLLDKY